MMTISEQDEQDQKSFTGDVAVEKHILHVLKGLSVEPAESELDESQIPPALARRFSSCKTTWTQAQPFHC